jgi:hypothetical protein
MTGEVIGKKGQKLTKHGIITSRELAPCQYDFSAGADRVVNFVTLAEMENTTHRFRHRGLIAVSQSGFDFKGGWHGSLQVKDNPPRW